MDHHTSSQLEHAPQGLGEREASLEGEPAEKRMVAIPNEQGSLCENCAGIDFDALAQRQYIRARGKFIMELGSTATLALSRCPLCRLFASISPTKEEDLESIPVHLRAFSAYHEYAGMHWPPGELTDNTLLGVVSELDRELESQHILDQTITLQMLATMRKAGLLFVTDGNNGQHSSAFNLRFVNSNSFDIDIARYWQDYCLKNHTLTCGQLIQPRPNLLRLIDCKTRKIVRPSSWVEYAALSYVWGEPGLGKTIQKVDDLVIHDIPGSLSKTIEDSMDVAKSLGIWYLWVDRYCIDQTSPGDKHHQIQQMDAIYKSAQLTIIAAAGNGPDYGLPGINSTGRLSQQVLRIGDRFIGQTSPHPSILVSKSKWATRGW